MQGRNEMERLLDDLVTGIVEEAMAQVVDDSSTQDWVSILTELRDRCRPDRGGSREHPRR